MQKVKKIGVLQAVASLGSEGGGTAPGDTDQGVTPDENYFYG